MENVSESKEVTPEAKAPAVPTLWMGLDWADREHVVAVRKPGASVATRQTVENKPAALEAFLMKLHQEHPEARIGVCLEQSRGPVIYALMKYDFVVIYPVNPRALAEFRRAFTVSGAKSDPRDADLLCELGAKHHERLRPLQPEDPLVRQLRLEVEGRRHFVDERTAGLNGLSATLKSYYPLAVELLGEHLDSAMALEFLRRWPNLARLKKARPAVLRTFFYQHNSRSEERIKERLAAIETAVALTEDAALVGPLELHMTCLLRQISTAQKSVKEYDERIESTFGQLTEAGIFRELPGAGKVLAPRLAALFGTKRDNWKSAEDVQCWTGVAPVRRQSGNKNTVHFRRARPVFVHQSLIEFAKCSVAFCAWARLLYQDQVKKAKSTFAAIRMVAFKWVRILYRCWKDGVVYDETKYLRSLQQRGVKLYESLYVATPA